MKGKRGQAAMEFLMTYGWAILVVLAAIGALAYFGVMSPTKFVPEKCVIGSTSGIACLDFGIESNTAKLYIINGGGRDVYLYNISVGDCGKQLDQGFLDGQKILVNVTGCDFGNKGDKAKEEISMTYSLTGSSLKKTINGEIVAQVS